MAQGLDCKGWWMCGCFRISIDSDRFYLKSHLISIHPNTYPEGLFSSTWRSCCSPSENCPHPGPTDPQGLGLTHLQIPRAWHSGDSQVFAKWMHDFATLRPTRLESHFELRFYHWLTSSSIWTQRLSPGVGSSGYWRTSGLCRNRQCGESNSCSVCSQSVPGQKDPDPESTKGPG